MRRRRIAAAALTLALAGGVAVALASGGGGTGGGGTGGGGAAAGSGRAGARPSAAAAIAWRARRARAQSAAETAEIERLLRLGLPIYCAGHRGRELAFTFDDGPGPYTHFALRKLRQAHERATFFVVGKSMNSYPRWVRREVKVAAIGDHTYTHPELIALPEAMIVSELERTARKIEAVTGRRAELFRPPYGLHDATVDAIARRLGLLEIIWSVDSRDSLGANWAGIIRNVEAGMRPGAIILMHENRGQTIRALTTLLPALHRRHLRSVSVPELLAADPPSAAQVRRGAAGCGVRRVIRTGA